MALAAAAHRLGCLLPLGVVVPGGRGSPDLARPPGPLLGLPEQNGSRDEDHHCTGLPRCCGLTFPGRAAASGRRGGGRTPPGHGRRPPPSESPGTEPNPARHLGAGPHPRRAALRPSDATRHLNDRTNASGTGPVRRVLLHPATHRSVHRGGSRRDGLKLSPRRDAAPLPQRRAATPGSQFQLKLRSRTRGAGRGNTWHLPAPPVGGPAPIGATGDHLGHVWGERPVRAA
jgi:hypothetical protein